MDTRDLPPNNPRSSLRRGLPLRDSQIPPPSPRQNTSSFRSSPKGTPPKCHSGPQTQMHTWGVCLNFTPRPTDARCQGPGTPADLLHWAEARLPVGHKPKLQSSRAGDASPPRTRIWFQPSLTHEAREDPRGWADLSSLPPKRDFNMGAASVLHAVLGCVSFSVLHSSQLSGWGFKEGF